MLRIIIAGLLGGLAMYAWSAVAHIATPLGEAGFSTMPNEAAVTSALKASLGNQPGRLYLFPAAAAGTPNLPGPSGLVVYLDGPNDMSPKALGEEAAVQLAEGLLAAFLLSVTALSGYLGRVLFVSGLGLVAVLSSNPSLGIWYKFPTEYVGATMFIDLVGYVFAGLVIAAILRPRAAAST